MPNIAVFCSSLTSWFLGMLLTYFLNDFEMVPVAPFLTGITLVYYYYYYYYYYYVKAMNYILEVRCSNLNLYPGLT